MFVVLLAVTQLPFCWWWCPKVQSNPLKDSAGLQTRRFTHSYEVICVESPLNAP